MRPSAVARTAAVGAVVAAATASWGCTLAPSPQGPASAGEATLPPPGYGTLLQSEVTMRMLSGALEIQVTPLAESVTRVTAPDTYQRLAGLASTHGPSLPDGSVLFLVSFYSEQPGVRFVPEEVQLISRGLRMRPVAIVAVTPSWGQRRLRQRATEMAIYGFPPGTDLESDLVLAYELEENASWSGILPRIQAERGRARARATGR